MSAWGKSWGASFGDSFGAVIASSSGVRRITGTEEIRQTEILLGMSREAFLVREDEDLLMILVGFLSKL